MLEGRCVACLMVFLIGINFYLTSAQQPNGEFESKFQFDNYTCEDTMRLFVEQNCNRPLECSAICLKSGCQGFFYGHVSETCYGCKVGVRNGPVNSKFAPSSSQTKFYLLKNAVTHGTPCSTTAGCGSREYCGSAGTCICEPGFSYYAYLNRCNNDCFVFGDTYEVHPGKMLNQHTLKEFTVPTRESCEQNCNDNQGCRTYNYISGSSLCRIKSETAESMPVDFINDAESVHAQRNCA